MKTHNMKLITKYFDYIKDGSKKIELRLNDEKRRLINIGDEIIFEEVSDNPRYLSVKVTNLYHYNTFEELIDNFDIKLLAGENIEKEELLNIIDGIYTKEEQRKYGALGIEVETI